MTSINMNFILETAKFTTPEAREECEKRIMAEFRAWQEEEKSHIQLAIRGSKDRADELAVRLEQEQRVTKDTNTLLSLIREIVSRETTKQ